MAEVKYLYVIIQKTVGNEIPQTKIVSSAWSEPEDAIDEWFNKMVREGEVTALEAIKLGQLLLKEHEAYSPALGQLALHKIPFVK